MRTLSLLAALAVSTAAVPAFAQDMSTTTTTTDTTTTTTSSSDPLPADTARAPDGTRAFGIEPYVAVMGGWEGFDRSVGHGIPNTPIGGRKLQGAIVTGIVGVNIPLGPVFVGAEGEATKGVDGAIDWGYGAAGRFGFRAGESGLFYGKVGYRWVNFDRFGNNSPDYHAITYGVGAEIGPKDIGLGGITGNSGVRLRMEVSTFGSAASFRPQAGIVAHF